MPNDLFEQYLGLPDYNPDEPLVVDATSASGYGSQINPNLEHNFDLSKGRYKFTIRNPQSPDKIIVNEDVFCPTDTGSGEQVYKRITINRIKYDLGNNKAYAYITIHENPIPLIVVWGSVLIATAIVGAIAVDSILEDVEYLGSTVFDELQETLKSPVVFILAIAIAGFLLLPYVTKKK